MKRIVSLLLIIAFSVLLTSCEEIKTVSVVEGSTEFTKDNFPKICTTAYASDIANAYTFAALGEIPEECVILENDSAAAYKKLISRECDIVIAHAPQGEGKAALQSSGVTIKSEPLLFDALVFYAVGDMGNIDLTPQTAADVFTGKITNFSELGGSDHIISPSLPQDGYVSGFLESITGELEGFDMPTVKIVTEEGNFAGKTVFGGKPGTFSACMLSNLAEIKARYGTVTVATVSGVSPIDAADMTNSLTYEFASYISVSVRADVLDKSNIDIIYKWMTGEQGKEVISPLNEKYMVTVG